MILRVGRRVLTRLLTLVLVAVAVSLLTFLLLRINRDPVRIVTAKRGLEPTPQVLAQVSAELGTDRPLLVQYGSWLAHAVRGDLGNSYIDGEAVTTKIGRALPVNLELVLLAEFLALLPAIPLGLWAGSRAGKRADVVISTGAFALISFPGFALVIVLVSVFAVRLGWFPVTATGYVGFFESPARNLRVMFLPALSLALGLLATYVRVLRSDVVDTLQQDHVLMARAKGLPRRRVLWGHTLRPSSSSLLTVAGLQIGALIGGSVLIEVLFAFRSGLGRELVQSALVADIPVLLGVTTVVCVIYVAVNVVVDACYAVLDPRLGER